MKWRYFVYLFLFLAFVVPYVPASTKGTLVERVEHVEHDVKDLRKTLNELLGAGREVQILKNQVRQLNNRLDALEETPPRSGAINVDSSLKSTLRREFRRVREQMEELEWRYRQQKQN